MPDIFGQLLAGQRTKRVFAGVKEHVRHIHNEAAGGVASLQNQIELLEETRAKIFAVAKGLLKLRADEAAAARIPVGIRFGYLFAYAVRRCGLFRIGLSASSLLGGGLRVEVLAVGFVALANGVSGNGFGVDAALRFELARAFEEASRPLQRCASVSARSSSICSRDFTSVFRGLYDFARLGN